MLGEDKAKQNHKKNILLVKTKWIERESDNKMWNTEDPLKVAIRITILGASPKLLCH